MNPVNIEPSVGIMNAIATPEVDKREPSGKGIIHDLIPENDPRLRQVSDPFDFNGASREEIDQLYWDMVDTMRYNKGVGLSAIQIGKPIRLFVMETGGEHPEAIFNPRIVNTEGEQLLEEGCLSFPYMWVKVRRPTKVRLRYQLINGETVTREFIGFTARVILHEYDHLDGITMKDRANKIHWEAALRKRKTYRKRAK